MNQNKEIDLKDLIILTFNFLTENLIQILIITLISILIAILVFLTTKVKYRNTIIVTTPLKYKKAEGSYVTNLQSIYSLLRDIKKNTNNKIFFEKYFDITSPIKLNIEIIKDKNFGTTDPSHIEIEMTTTNLENFKKFENNLAKYFNSQSYLISELDNQNATFKEVYQKISQNLEWFEKLKSQSNFKSNINAEFYSFIGLITQMNFYNRTDTCPLIYVKKFSAYPIEENNKLSWAIISFTVSFLVMLIIFVIVKIIIQNAKIN